MASEFITRVEHGKDEPYTIIFRTDDADKYKHIEDECRKMIGHAKPTVDAVPVARCRVCKMWNRLTRVTFKDERKGLCEHPDHIMPTRDDFYCADGERRSDGEQ